ncbi:MAG TPA: TetR/AcrR family transcriptional regulator [Ilumatobacteraceae bacterium]|nr:TetR/AcrR family transcriptional regulator [Ilumatobacteraceae bacterium]
MPAADGRRLRRDRNRDAVVDALLDLIRAGEMAPSADAVAARAGLSARSVFRYFDDIDDLCRVAITHQLAAVRPVLHTAISAAGPLDERIAALVGQRVRLFEAMGSVGTFARLRAPFQPLVAEQLDTARRILRDRLRATLGPELDTLDVETADSIVAAADVLCSFESFRLLREVHGRSARAAAGVMTDGVRALLAAAAVRA